MARLKKSQEYAILWLYQENKSPKEISEELSLTEKQVVSCIKRNAPETTTSQKTESNNKKSSKDFMITHTSSKQDNTVAIMTKEASEMNDEFTKKNRPTYNNNTPNIHKIS
jgi:hypothetical protein